MKTSRRATRLVQTIALVVGFILIAAPAVAVDGSVTVVIVGGRQSPAKRYTFDSWQQRYCEDPRPKVETYIRWYIREVESRRAYINKVYMNVTPTRNGNWEGMQLVSPSGELIKRKTLFADVRRGETRGSTMYINRWVRINRESGAPIEVQNVFDINVRSGESIYCGGPNVSYNQLFRR